MSSGVNPEISKPGAAYWDQSEANCVQTLPGEIGLSVGERKSITAEAQRLMLASRELHQSEGLVANLLREFDLASDEGVALLCIAEAIMRIPDAATADSLISSRIAGPEWSKHLGWTHDWFANTTSAALMVSGNIMGQVDSEGAFARMTRRLGEPVVRQSIRTAVGLLGSQFIYAKTIAAAVDHATDGLFSFDMLGEGARTMPDAQRYLEAYSQAVEVSGAKPGKLGPHGVSIKLSALHPRFEATQRGRVMDELVPKLRGLAQQAAHANVSLTIDAEEMARYDLTMEVLEAVASDPGTRGWPGLGCAIQAYSKRALECVQTVREIAEATQRRMTPRLVKGAYWDTEIKLAQEQGLRAYPVFTVKAHTDASYMACARRMLDCRDMFFPCFATHNAHTAAVVLHLAGDGSGWEFQRLHGMAPNLHQALNQQHGTKVRTYAPVGNHRDLLAYLIRRLLENGANSSFLAQSRDESVPVEELIADPLKQLGAASSIPDPCGFVPGRQLAGGLHLARADHRAKLIAAAAAENEPQTVVRQVVSLSAADRREVVNPATGAVVGIVHEASAETAKQALDEAAAAQPAWNATPVERRAEILLGAADLMQQGMETLVALVAREGGRTLEDGIAEVREAIDFLRYYAAQAVAGFAPRRVPGPTGEHNILYLEGKGTFLCISPWNFPLAIFTGQIAAALAAGNAVLAKPAEQTPLCAAAAVEILCKAGVPSEVLKLLPGDGSMISGAVLGDDRLAGVAFTGSFPTAKLIERALADRTGPMATLIAETGGINAMIVDSSALVEQVTRDVLASSFRSAGQRCSGLRALYIQEDCAEEHLRMICGALEELNVGDPSDPAVDVGPLIDAQAHKNVAEWVAGLPERGAKPLAVHALANVPEGGSFFAPQIWQLPGLDMPEREVFGPVLHVLRFGGTAIDEVLDKILQTGHALTFSVHSRSEHRIAHICSKAPAGNVYVNRNQIGAVVEANPFGGYGLSGTGPKAGGPQYLLRFAREKTISRDVTAAGGNVELVTGKNINDIQKSVGSNLSKR